MRIRRNASKLLGSASVYANPCSPPADVTGLVCELTCSPWDVMLIDNLPNSSSSSSSSCCCCCSLTNPKGEDEGGGGIFGNSFKTEEEEPISAVTSTAAELTIKAILQTDEKKAKKLERKKSNDNKQKAAADTTITYCKKNDGKGWHCKRPAQLPHSFCSYHLAQTRFYSSNHRATDHASESTAAETRAEAGDSNNLYYYHDGFGPWRGKRRGRAVNISAKVKEEGKEDGRKSMGLDGDDHINVVAGDDEYDLNCFDEDKDDDDNDSYSLPRQDHNEGNGNKRDGEELMKKRVIKKRGRKPLKSRSLKSLL